MSAQTTTCPRCNAQLPAAARFCIDCGGRVAPRPEPISWGVAERRSFGVLPGRSALRSAKVRLARLWGLLLARLRFGREALAARSRAQLELARLRREAGSLAVERDRAVFELGDATYRGDRGRAGTARKRLAELDERLADGQRRMVAVHEGMRGRIERAQLEGGRTVAVELPPTVPEPAPEPSEPPGPVIVPEPEPVPHEPPGPVIVPEPEPPRSPA